RTDAVVDLHDGCPLLCIESGLAQTLNHQGTVGAVVIAHRVHGRRDAVAHPGDLGVAGGDLSGTPGQLPRLIWQRSDVGLQIRKAGLQLLRSRGELDRAMVETPSTVSQVARSG